MKPILRLLCAAVALALLSQGSTSRAEAIEAASFGSARVVAPAGAPLSFVALFSDEAGWTPDDDRALAEIARNGALAVGIDTKDYLLNLQANRNAVRNADCVDFFQDVEDLSRQVQGRHPSPFYNLPIVAGLGEGGAIAYAALAQAPIATLSAAISLDPTLTLDISRSLCRLDSFPAGASGIHRLGVVTALHGVWRAAYDEAAPPTSRASAEELARAGVPIEIAPMRGTDSRRNLVALVEREMETAAKRGIGSLPLVELPSDRPSRAMAVLVSGDGGWRDLDKTIGEKLQSLGVPVVGWDSLRYFWSRKTPEQTTADLTAVLAAYGAKWRADKFVLIGYSFGADVLPVVYNRLPAAYRDRVAMISLLGVEPKADWEIRVAGWFGAQPSETATPLAPEFAKIPGELIQCYYGVEEKDPGCVDLADKRSELIQTPGAHHFGGDYDAIAKDILDGLRRRSAL